jgi:hypothetical protein
MRGRKPRVVDTMKAGRDMSSGLVSSRTGKEGMGCPREPMVARTNLKVGFWREGRPVEALFVSMLECCVLREDGLQAVELGAYIDRGRNRFRPQTCRSGDICQSIIVHFLAEFLFVMA